MTQKILKLPAVMAMTGLSRSSIYAFIQKQTFPAPVPLGARAVGWVESEVCDFLTQRASLRQNGGQK